MANGSGKRGNLSAITRKARAISMLIAGEKHAVIARECGVSISQLVRWSKDGEVREKCEAAAKEIEMTAGRILVDAARKAAEKLTEMLDEPGLTPADRTRVALAILDRTGLPAMAKSEATHVHTGPKGGPQEHVVVLTVEQMRAGARDGSIPGEDDDAGEES